MQAALSSLDLVTIIVVNTVVLAIVSLTLLVTRLTLGPAAAGAATFVAGTTLIGLANVGALIDERSVFAGWLDQPVGGLPPPATLSGALVLAGVWCHLCALQRVAGMVRPWWHIAVQLSVVGASWLLLAALLDGTVARLKLLSLLLALLSLAMMPVVLRLARRLWGARTIFAVLACTVIALLARASGLAPVALQLEDLAANFIVQLVVVLTLSLGFLILVQEQVRLQLAELSRTDPLTGLLNRRGLLDLLERDLDRARRLRRPLSLALFDIDHFKRINDSRGHAAGDAVLKALGNCLLRQCRRSDLSARWGGEEFVVVMPETSLAEATAVAERVRTDVRTATLLGSGGGRVTISGGVVEADLRLEGQAAIDRLLQSADRLLYAAKTTRDRIAVVNAVVPAA